MRILVYGSSFLAERCINALRHDSCHRVIGQVPNVDEPTVPSTCSVRHGGIPEPWSYDLALSVQYDRKIPTSPVGLNLHTGLLPDWGGCDILHHTLQQGARTQGLTLHKVTDQYDCGPIISTVTYPVLANDSVVSLYAKVIALAPSFLLGALSIVEHIGLDALDACPSMPPRLFKRGAVAAEDYVQIKQRLREFYRVA